MYWGEVIEMHEGTPCLTPCKQAEAAPWPFTFVFDLNIFFIFDLGDVWRFEWA